MESMPRSSMRSSMARLRRSGGSLFAMIEITSAATSLILIRPASIAAQAGDIGARATRSTITSSRKYCLIGSALDKPAKPALQDVARHRGVDGETRAFADRPVLDD